MAAFNHDDSNKDNNEMKAKSEETDSFIQETQMPHL